MSNINTGGSAFPIPGMAERWDDCKGMTLRDYFAATAVQGIAAQGELRADLLQYIGADAYRLADAMLKAREA